MAREPIAISALQHYAYCPRQFALIHVEQVWEENRMTAEGRLLHQRVDSGESETRQNIRTERGVLLCSQQYCLTGKMDLLEIEQDSVERYIPVEYKKGKKKLADWDRIQLCAQALCLEEMREISIEQGAIWYWQERRREVVIFDQVLRDKTLATIEEAHKVIESGVTPKPVSDRTRCRGCSLAALCQPKTFRQDRSAQYIKTIFEQ